MMNSEPQSSPVNDRRELVPVGTPRATARRESARFSPPPSNGRITPAFILWVLSRWFAVAAPVALILGGAGAVVSWMAFKPKFEAEAWIRIEDRRPYVAFPSQEESKRFEKTQVETIRSPIVLSKCFSQPDIAQLPELKAELDPVKWAAKKLSIVGVADSELFRIKFQGPNPTNAAKICNAIVDTYLNHHLGEATLEAQKMIETLNRLKADRVHELERMQERVRTLTKQVTGKDIGVVLHSKQEKPVVSPLASLETRLSDVEVERQVIEVQLEAAQQSLEREEEIAVPETTLEQVVANDTDVVEMTATLQEIRAQYREYERVSAKPEQLDAVKDLTTRYKATASALAKRKAEIRQQGAKEIQAGLLASRKDKVEALTEELKQQKMLEQLLHDRLQAERAELEKNGDQALNLEFARNEMERAEEVFHRIADRIMALQTEKAAEARVSILSSATAPVEPVTTQTKFVAGVAGVLFVLPFALALLWELRVRRVATVDQLQDEARLPVLGEITEMPIRSMLPGRRADARFERQRSAFEESIAHLRTSLVLNDDTSNLQIFAVASAVSREGKTSVAAQLATNLAKASNQPTLLVDADLRDPDIHQVLGVALGPGLADVLSHKVSLEEAIVPSAIPNVWVLPAGQSPVSPHTLFTIDTYQSVLEALRAQYRYIVFDCPPLLSASEALTVAKSADGVMLCTRRDVSRVSQVRDARDRLIRAGAQLLGVVLSGVSAKNYAARYGGYGYATVVSETSFGSTDG
ncbi:MAG TPA: polysaccharide biosynthesis tyrosine autokinase [Pirellulales bacterium]|jgi:capsular exopolysaccharide synthesis family protein